MFSLGLYLWKYRGKFVLINFLSEFFACEIEGTYWFVYSLICLLIINPFLAKIANGMKKFEKNYL